MQKLNFPAYSFRFKNSENKAAIFDEIDRLGYTGWIGCEYRPERGTAPHATRDGLGWMPR